AVELAEDHAHGGADLVDHAGLDDGSRELRDTAHYSLTAEDRDQPVGGVDAVLQRDDRSVGADQRLDMRARALAVPQLYREQPEIDLADVGGIVGRLRWLQMGLAAAALDLEAGALHGGEMRAARDEGDIRAGLRQCCSKTAPDAAGADHCNPHQLLLMTLIP